MKRSHYLRSVIGLVVGLSVIGLAWWYVTARELVRPVFVPSPQAVFKAALATMRDGGLRHDFAATFIRVGEAWLLAGALGTVLGLALGTNPRVFAYVSGLVNSARALPTLAIFPLTLIFFSISEASIIGLSTFTGIWIVLLAVVHGIEQTSPEHVAQARRLGFSGFEMALRLYLFSSLPHLTSALRQVAGLCCAVTIGAEMFIGATKIGVGIKILDAQNYFRSDLVFLYMAAAAAIGLLYNFFASLLTLWLLRWQRQAPP